MSRSSGKVILLTSIKTFDPRHVYLFRQEFFNEGYIDDFILKYYISNDVYGEDQGVYFSPKGQGNKYVVVRYD